MSKECGSRRTYQAKAKTKRMTGPAMSADPFRSKEGFLANQLTVIDDPTANAGT
jgi:hypothetical protein